MIERVYDHILKELQMNTRTDTIFVLTAILLNFISLAINSAISSSDTKSTSQQITIIVFLILTIVVNLVAVLGLIKGKITRGKLLNGLIKMYKDQNVDGYYDATLISNYNTRYTMFIIAICTLGVVALAIPLINWIF